MTMKASEYADLMYLGPHAKYSHWVPWGEPRALCGLMTTSLSAEHTIWYGTGCMEEYDHAELLQLCVKCAEAAS